MLGEETMPDTSDVPVCDSRRTEEAGSRLNGWEAVEHGCWLPEGHDGPHWGMIRWDSGLQVRAWHNT